MTTEQTTFSLGGEGGSYFSFGKSGAQPGAGVQGTILDMKMVQSTDYKTQKPETWDNGDPKMQYRVTLQTQLKDDPSDDGKRDIYLDGRRKVYNHGGKSKLCAVLDAVRDATGSVNLEYGATLALQWVSGMGVEGDPRCFQAWYTRPSMPLQQPAEHKQPAPLPPQDPAAFQSPGQPPAWAQQQQTPAPPPVQQQFQPPAQAQAPAQQPGAMPMAGVAGQGITAEQVAGLKALNVDPATVFGPDWQQRIVG